MTSLYDCVKAGKYVRDGVKMEKNLRDCVIGHPPPGGASYTEKMMNFLKKSEYGSVPFGGMGGGSGVRETGEGHRFFLKFWGATKSFSGHGDRVSNFWGGKS